MFQSTPVPGRQKRLKEVTPHPSEIIPLKGEVSNRGLFLMKTGRFVCVPIPYAKVLIVDDVPTNLLFAKGILKPYRMQIDCATSGFEAIKCIRNPTVRYDAIFMDQMMPDMDGIETTRIIREEIDSDYAKNIPIIALTASDIIDGGKMFLEKGFQAFLSKPINIMRMDAVLQQWVRSEKREQKDATFANSAFTIEAEPGDTGQVYKEGIPKVEGIDWQTGLSRCGGNRESYLFVIRTYVDNIERLLAQISNDTEETLADYMIHVHGIKGSSYSIGANEIGKQAEELEHAARTGNIQLVIRNTPLFVENGKKLLNALSNLLKDYAKETGEKPSQHAPNEALLDRMEEAAANFKIDEMEETMKLLECFEYETQAELINWLRGKINQMDFLSIHERLVRRKQKVPEGRK